MAPHSSFGLYESMFWSGLRFPLLTTICEILNFYNISPAQLSPNAWTAIIGFLTLASSLSLPVNAAVFSWFHKIQRHPQCMGFWYFTSDKTSRLLYDIIDRDRNWKSRFFFVTTSEDWGFPNVWSDDVRSPVCPELKPDEFRSACKLMSLDPVSFKEIVNEGNLVAAGLSHFHASSVADLRKETRKLRKYSKTNFTARVSKRHESGHQRKKVPCPSTEWLDTSFGPPEPPQEPRSDILEFDMGQSARAPLHGTQVVAFGSIDSDMPDRFCPMWNISMDDTIADQATAIEMLSHFLPPKDEVAAERASFEELANDGYGLLAKKIFTHQGLISKVKYGARRMEELSSNVSREVARNQQLTDEIEELHRKLASVELEKGKEIEAIKLSAAKAVQAAKKEQMDYYLDGFEQCKHMAYTSFPSMDFGFLVPFPSTSGAKNMEIPEFADDGGDPSRAV